MISFKLLNDTSADEVLVPAKIELAICQNIYAGSNDMYVLTSFVVMKKITAKMSVSEAHSLHVIVSDSYPLLFCKSLACG
ncbi:hypothetical protein K6W48_11125 [Erwinia amylovora]|nr:hypothetical protein [Erwinia amylovora]